MALVIRCSKVVPESGCPHSIRGETEEELLKNAEVHAKEHGIVQVTPELVQRLKTFIERE